MTAETQNERLIDAVKQSTKYRHVNAEFIGQIGMEQLSRHSKLKEAIKATKNKLHQTCGAYLAERIDYTRWVADLSAAQNDEVAFRALCIQMMKIHRSTLERVSILDQFYSEIFQGLPAVNSVIDIACGLNPLAIPWMKLGENPTYFALDVYDDLADFMNQFFKISGIRGVAQSKDVLTWLPTQHADLALLLKAIPCLEQIDPSAGGKLLETINATYIVVSFPIQTLTGRTIGMETFYEQHFCELVATQDWHIERLLFDTELVFLVNKG